MTDRLAEMKKVPQSEPTMWLIAEVERLTEAHANLLAENERLAEAFECNRIVAAIRSEIKT